MTQLEQIGKAFAERGMPIYVHEHENLPRIGVMLPKPFDDFGLTLFFDGYENVLRIMLYEAYAGSTIDDHWTEDFSPEHIISEALLKVLSWERHCRVICGEEEDGQDRIESQ